MKWRREKRERKRTKRKSLFLMFRSFVGVLFFYKMHPPPPRAVCEGKTKNKKEIKQCFFLRKQNKR